MKKKVGLGILITIEIICIIGIYIIGGQVGAWLWTSCVFIVAPIASIVLLVQIILGIIRTVKKKNVKWNIVYIMITIIIAYPITILFGISLLTYPTNGNKSDVVKIINPVKESILLGGKEYKTHSVWPSECYAYDILKKPYDINSNKLSDYGIYLADVYCPVSGTIIDLKDIEEDILPNTEEFKSSFGNYIFIKIKETGTYFIIAHLEKDSINLSVGDNVTKGMYLGKVGNSGTTSEPHLHIQHQREKPIEKMFTICSEGLPIEFESNN